MGTVLSQGILFGTSDLTEEVQQSINQIYRAFTQEFVLESRRHHPSTISHFTHMQNEEPINVSRHRSRSLDRYQPEEHQHIIEKKLSTIKRHWQCQLCHTKNESDTLICSDCGSNKINVYIPIFNHMNQTRQQYDPSALAVVR